mmetsp:Transcript_38508/g.81695  ORF Transcript_38508/g.81695 Transcript_38508/m.81695 type:complete len:85 (-) Transcript_38508:590-844(-)
MEATAFPESQRTHCQVAPNSGNEPTNHGRALRLPPIVNTDLASLGGVQKYVLDPVGTGFVPLRFDPSRCASHLSDPCDSGDHGW